MTRKRTHTHQRREESRWRREDIGRCLHNTAGTVGGRLSQSNISVSRDPARKAKVLTAPPRPNGGVLTSGTPPTFLWLQEFVVCTNGVIRPHSRCAEFFEKAQISERGLIRRREGRETAKSQKRRAPSKSSTGLVLLDASSAKLQRRFVRAHNSNDKTNVTNRPLPTETATSVQCSRRGRREVIAGRAQGFARNYTLHEKVHWQTEGKANGTF